jgi:hypothetical protein
LQQHFSLPFPHFSSDAVTALKIAEMKEPTAANLEKNLNFEKKLERNQSNVVINDFIANTMVWAHCWSKNGWLTAKKWQYLAKLKLSRSAFFDEKSIPFHERYPHSP